MATTATTITEQQSPASKGHATHHQRQAVAPRLDAPDEGRYVSKETYWATYYAHADASYEWNNGYLEAKPLSTAVQYRLFLWFLKLLHEYVTIYGNADLMSLETGFTLTVPNPDVPGTLKETVRKPDLAAIRHDNPIQWGEHEHSYKGICDLCLESLSDSSIKEILRDTKIKKSEYAFAGVQEYYILDPTDTHMHFYQLATTGEYLEIQPDAHGVIHSSVLPGFQFRLTDLQRLPELEDLALDEVYQGYVLLRYRAAVERAALADQRALAAEQRVHQEALRAREAMQRAAQEQQRAAQANQRAEKYAALLRELGVVVDEP